jgi:hypothetical protein
MDANPYQSPEFSAAKPGKRRWIIYELAIFAITVVAGIFVAGLISKEHRGIGAGIGGGIGFVVSAILRNRYFPVENRRHDVRNN